MAPDPAASGVRKLVTVVSCDVAPSRPDRGSHPQTYDEVLRGARLSMQGLLERRGATIQETPGDVITAVFGIPLVHEHDAWRAIRAVVELPAVLDSLGGELRPDSGLGLTLRAGISGGVVTMADPGDGRPIAVGEPLTLASQLRQAARPGDMLMTVATHQLVKHVVRAEAVVLYLDGPQHPPVRALRLLELLRGAPARPRHFDSPMIGRERDHRLLTDVLERATADRTCYLSIVLGEAGIGKSRLVQEFAESVAGRATVLRGQCLWYGDGITFWPLKTVVQDGAALLDNDGPDEIHEKLVALLSGEPQAETVADQVAQVLGIIEPTGPPEQAFWSVRRLLEALARARPLVLVFDDIQWAEPTFLSLVEHIVDYARDAPILVVCLARRDELLEHHPAWVGGKMDATTISLAALNETESQRLLVNLLGDERLAKRAWTRIGGAATGNPLFVEEMVGMLVDDGLLHLVDGRWRLAGDLLRVRVPPSLRELLAERLDWLSPASRAVVERAAVVGQVFYHGAVTELVPEDVRPEVDASVVALIRRGFIRRVPPELLEDDTYQFRHLLILDVAYASLPESERAELHMRFARWLERVLGKRAKEVDEIIGYHLERAYQYRSRLEPIDQRARQLANDAAERLARAGQRAFYLGDTTAAISLLRRAKDLREESDPARLSLLAQMGQALRVAGDLPAAELILAEVIDSAAANGDSRLEQAALIERAFVRLYSDPEGQTREALAQAQRAIRVFESLGDDRRLAEAWILVSVVHLMRNEIRERKRALEQALVHARRSGDTRSEAWIIWGVISSMAYGPNPVAEAVAYAEAQLEAARTKGNRVLEAGAIVHLGRLEAMLGRFTEARDHVARAHRLCEELGMRSWAAVCLQMSGFVESMAGDLLAAEQDLRNEYRELAQLGDKTYLATSAAHLADVLYGLGRDDEAMRLTRITEELAATDDVDAQILWRGARAKAMARGDPEHRETALALAQEGADLARWLDDPNTRAGALMDLAETMHLCGRSDGVADVVMEAIRLYEQKGNVVAAQRAGAMLRKVA
jgi:class 3 adenylate cyclase/tetratricopeptide (TPR) repeat protein